MAIRAPDGANNLLVHFYFSNFWVFHSTLLCTPGLDRKDPCVTCNADAMCTKMDVKTGQKKHTFIKDYKKEHRVKRWHVYLFMCLYRLGERIKPLTRDLA